MITRETRKLLGLVKKVEAEFAVFEMINGNLTETRNQSAGYSIYDLEGKLIEEVSPHRFMMYDAYRDVYFYDEKGDLDYREEYDENNSLIGKTMFERSVDDNLIEKHYYFDKQGRLKLGSHFIYEGDTIEEDDSLIEIAHYDENEEIIPRHVYKCNSSEEGKTKKSLEDGYIIEQFRNNEDEALTEREVRLYDSKGNIREVSCFASDGTLTLKDEYEYEFDSVGNWIKLVQKHWVIGWGKLKLIPLTVTRLKIYYFQNN